ncbi:MAG TPA: hypothetical protein VM287_03690 [Egibacteraceae bacterium]|nr:hypothetical protein [Egibacteraceae bacterium]
MLDMRNCSRTTTRVALAALLALLLLAAPAGAAGVLLDGSGTGTITGLAVTPIREVAGISQEARTLTGVIEGTLEGTYVQETVGVVNRNRPENTVTFRGVLTFTGTVEGCGDEVHTLVLGLVGRGTVPVPGFPVTEAFLWVIRHPDNTLNATGHGTASQVGADLTYELQYTCR